MSNIYLGDFRGLKIDELPESDEKADFKSDCYDYSADFTEKEAERITQYREQLEQEVIVKNKKKREKSIFPIFQRDPDERDLGERAFYGFMGFFELLVRSVLGLELESENKSTKKEAGRTI